MATTASPSPIIIIPATEPTVTFTPESSPHSNPNYSRAASDRCLQPAPRGRSAGVNVLSSITSFDLVISAAILPQSLTATCSARLSLRSQADYRYWWQHQRCCANGHLKVLRCRVRGSCGV